MPVRLLLALVPPLVPAADIFTGRIFGPEVPTGPYKHPASLCALDNGGLLPAYYGGEGEYAQSTAVFLPCLAPGARRWTLPVAVARGPYRSVGNGVRWQDPLGRVWLFCVIRFGPTWSTSRITAKVSDDPGRSWSDPGLLSLEEGWMVRGKPIVLQSGRSLFPRLSRSGRLPRARRAGDVFLLPDPRSRQRRVEAQRAHPLGERQPAALARRAFPRAICLPSAGVGAATARESAVSSSPPSPATAASPGRRAATRTFRTSTRPWNSFRLRSGRLLLVYNPSVNRRTPLTAALSEDGGKTWPWKKNLAEGDDSFAYPSAARTADGRIHVVYTSGGRKVIRRAVFLESDLLHREGSS